MVHAYKPATSKVLDWIMANTRIKPAITSDNGTSQLSLSDIKLAAAEIAQRGITVPANIGDQFTLALECREHVTSILSQTERDEQGGTSVLTDQHHHFNQIFREAHELLCGRRWTPADTTFEKKDPNAGRNFFALLPEPEDDEGDITQPPEAESVTQTWRVTNDIINELGPLMDALVHLLYVQHRVSTIKWLYKEAATENMSWCFVGMLTHVFLQETLRETVSMMQTMGRKTSDFETLCNSPFARHYRRHHEAGDYSGRGHGYREEPYSGLAGNRPQDVLQIVQSIFKQFCLVHEGVRSYSQLSADNCAKYNAIMSSNAQLSTEEEKRLFLLGLFHECDTISPEPQNRQEINGDLKDYANFQQTKKRLEWYTNGEGSELCVIADVIWESTRAYRSVHGASPVDTPKEALAAFLYRYWLTGTRLYMHAEGRSILGGSTSRRLALDLENAHRATTTTLPPVFNVPFVASQAILGWYLRASTYFPHLANAGSQVGGLLHMYSMLRNSSVVRITELPALETVRSDWKDLLFPPGGNSTYCTWLRYHRIISSPKVGTAQGFPPEFNGGDRIDRTSCGVWSHYNGNLYDDEVYRRTALDRLRDEKPDEKVLKGRSLRKLKQGKEMLVKDLGMDVHVAFARKEFEQSPGPPLVEINMFALFQMALQMMGGLSALGMLICVRRPSLFCCVEGHFSFAMAHATTDARAASSQWGPDSQYHTRLAALP
jgi:hypothetical protein